MKDPRKRAVRPPNGTRGSDRTERPPYVPHDVWTKIPSLAKKRLLANGPKSRDPKRVKDAQVTCAAELRLQGVPVGRAIAIVSQMPFTVNKGRRQLQREVADTVRWAYGADLRTAHSGCPALGVNGSKMRAALEPHCDETCKATCLIRRSQLPEDVLPGTSYEAVYRSPLWLANELRPARPLYMLFTSIAVTTGSPLVYCSMPYAVRRMDGRIPTKTLYRHSLALREVGLIEVVSRSKGLYRVPVLSPMQLAALEKKLGADEKARQNRIDATLSSLRKIERQETWHSDVEYGIQADMELILASERREDYSMSLYPAANLPKLSRDPWAGKLVNWPSIRRWTPEDEALYVANGCRFTPR